MTTPKHRRNALHDAEINALASQVMNMVKRDETIRTNGIYGRLMQQLKERATELEPAPKPPLRDVSDWLAVAFFLNNRRHFLAMCRAAEHYDDPIYRRAQPWLVKIIEHDLNMLDHDAKR
jgi:hypothetical protein